ncbi:DUF748 domain-containing protein [Laribacter hongkongensis]|uniref:DUF748 domain-containing protein n=1 Tax=Laribacter hongkongensis TaxID=168471 RepID=UPI001EFCE5DD|nr:DUF748 domain-containing protein [Laribacter hongkongensis]MCG9097221.1 DUF748 domain-containing protein [Laribacter hongkongensis]
MKFPSRLRKPLHVGVVTALTLAGLGVAVYLSGPLLLRGVAEEQLSEALGRPVSIGGLTLNVFTLGVTVGNVQISEPDGSTPFARLDRLEVHFSPRSLLGDWRIASLKLDTPDIRLVRFADNRFNISDLIERFQTPSGEPVLFALANARIRHGRIVLDDRPLNHQHTIDRLQLTIPYVSNFPADLDVSTQPEFSASINGKTVSLAGNSHVFRADRQTVMNLYLDGVDLAPMLAYLPVSLPVKIPSVRLDTRLRIAYSTPPKGIPSLDISGVVGLRRLALQNTDGQPLASAERIAFDIGSFRPFSRELKVREISIAAPRFDLIRAADNRFNWLKLVPPARPGNEKPPAGSAPGWQWAIDTVRLRRGELFMRDAALPRPFASELNDISLDLARLDQRMQTPVSARLRISSPNAESATLSAQIDPAGRTLTGDYQIDALDVARWRPYLDPLLASYTSLRPASLRLSSSGQLTLGAPQDDLRYAVQEGQLTLRELALDEPGGTRPAIQADVIEATGIRLDSQTRRLSLESLSINQPDINLRRLRQQDNFASWVRNPPARAAAARSKKTPDWRIQVGQTQVEQGQLHWSSVRERRPVKLDLSELSARLRGFDSARPAAMPLDLETRINRQGRVNARGQLNLAQSALKLQLNASRVDLVPLLVPPTSHIRVNIARAGLDARGELAVGWRDPGQPSLAYRGQAALRDVRIRDEINTGTELARWKQLGFNGIDLDWQAGTHKLHVGQIDWQQFFVQAVLNQNAQLNVRELRNDMTGAPGTPADAPAVPTVLPAAATASAVPLDLSIGNIRLQQGSVNWIDNFVRPNLRANITGLGGEIGRLSSQTGKTAEVDLKGRVNRDAPLVIQGRINPLVSPMALDLTATVKGMDLPPLTPYAAKYAGYPITKGKMSLDMHYSVAEQQLKAENRLFLDQLTFGDKVDSPDATSLPVLLAVDLLKNRDGVIDVNLPISGTLTDPDFSVGGIVMRVIVNLLQKAVTAPFDLLAHAFGGDTASLSSLDMVNVQPGPEERARLDQLAAILADKPSLRLEIQGRADLEGARRARLEDKIQARWQDRGGEPDSQPDAVARAAIIKSLYEDGSFKKPRNLIGIAKTLPTGEMEALLLANQAVVPREVPQIAHARALEVKRYLEDNAALDPARLFIVAAGDSTTGNGVAFSLK